jgi:hypothetical protein
MPDDWPNAPCSSRDRAFEIKCQFLTTVPAFISREAS